MGDEVMVKIIYKKVKIIVSVVCCVLMELSEFLSFWFFECYYEKREIWIVYFFLLVWRSYYCGDVKWWMYLFCLMWMGFDEFFV